MISTIKNYFSNRHIHMNEMLRRVEQINSLEPFYASMSDDDVRERINFYQYQAREGQSKSKYKNILINTFAIVREASKRVLGKRHYDVQLLGGLFLNRRCISEMQTGEGKTLVATAPAVYNAVIGNKVHIVTVNDYLALRDWKQMGELYTFLGISSGVILSKLTPEQRRESYSCDIVYGTNNEFGFDYLRDNMKAEDEPLVQGSLDFVIIDEVDSVLIDEARTPLIISAKGENHSEMYERMAEVMRGFKEDVDFKRDKDDKKVVVATDDGIHKVEQFFQIDNLYTAENSSLLNTMEQALKAHFVFERDKDYVVKDGAVVIVDDFTGRLMQGRRYSSGLHQAIEAKEKVELKEESKTVATITFQNFFRLYKKLSGMTGTAKTDEDEFFKTYGLTVVQIPKNKPSQRVDLHDVVFRSKDAKYKSVLQKIKECNATGQPILVGTTSILASETISELLQREGIKHHILNAKHDAEEAEIISHAGEIGAITIATNMAGRGTDIVPEEGVDELGGLFILGTEKHESRRIDNQLRGRTARQGAKGTTQFYISLEDDLFKYFGGEKLLNFFKRFQIDLDESPIESRYLTNSINKSQRRIEAKNFDIRKHLLSYDDVLNQQRNVIYKQRQEIKEMDYAVIKTNLFTFIEEEAKKVLDIYAPSEKYPEEYQLDELVLALDQTFGLDDIVIVDELKDLAKLDLDELVISRLKNIMELKESLVPSEILGGVLRTILLKFTDDLWADHINDMTLLKDGINLRAYGQLNPLYEYQKEAFEMFETMEGEIKAQFVRFALSLQIQLQPKEDDELVVREVVRNQLGELVIPESESE